MSFYFWGDITVKKPDKGITMSQPLAAEYKQSKNAIIISYALYRWFLACITMGIIGLLDYLNYKNTKLSFEPKFLIYVTGALTTHSKEIPYEDIKNVRVDQSIIGQWFKYGTVLISMKESADEIAFKYVHEPEAVRKAVQEMYIRADKVKLL